MATLKHFEVIFSKYINMILKLYCFILLTSTLVPSIYFILSHHLAILVHVNFILREESSFGVGIEKQNVRIFM